MKGLGLKLTSAVLALTVLLGVVACQQSPAPQQAAKPAEGTTKTSPSGPAMELKLSMYQPSTHIFVKTLSQEVPIVEKLTDGRVKVQIYDTEKLGKANEFIDMTQRGVTDIALSFPGYNSSTFPIFDDMSLPFMWRDIKGQLEAYENGQVGLWMEALKEKGLDKIGELGVATVGFRYLATKKKVVAPADMKGLKIRGMNSLEMKFVEAAGGAGVATVASEVYEAIQRGMIDGSIGNATNLVDWKWMEVAPNMLNLPIDATVMFMIYNTDSFNKIPAADRVLVEAGLRHAMAKLNLADILAEQWWVNTLMPTKMTYNTPTAEQKKQWLDIAAPLVDGYAKSGGARTAKSLEIIRKYNQ